jgi:hypothetical protein
MDSQDGGLTWAVAITLDANRNWDPTWISRLNKFLMAGSVAGNNQWRTSPDGHTWTAIRTYVTGQYGSRSAGG